MIIKAKKLTRLISLALCVGIASMLMAVPTAGAESNIYLQEDFSNSGKMTGRWIGSTWAFKNGELEAYTETAKTAANFSADWTLGTYEGSKVWKPDATKTYAAEVDVTTNRTQGCNIRLFGLNSTSATGVSLIYLKNGYNIFSPKGETVMVTSEGGSTYARLPLGEKSTIRVIIKENKAKDIYLNGSKLYHQSGGSFNDIPAEVTKFGFAVAADAWSQGDSYTRIDNIKFYEVPELAIEATTAEDGFAVVQKTIEVTMNGEITNEALTSSNVSVIKDGGSENLVSAVSKDGKSLKITLSAELEKETKYTLTVSGLTNIAGDAMKASDAVTFTTGAMSAYAFDSFGDGTANGYTAENGTAAIKADEPFFASKYLSLTPTAGEATASKEIPALTFEGGKTYSFSAYFKGTDATTRSKLFAYGDNTASLVSVEQSTTDSSKLGIYAGGSQLAVIDAGKWANIAVQVNGSTKDYDVYVNSEKVNSSPISGAAVPNELKSLSFTSANTESGFAQIGVARLFDFEVLDTSMAKTDKTDIYAKELRITFNQFIDSSTLSTVTVTQKGGSGAAVTPSLDSADKKTLVLTIADTLNPNAEYIISLSGLRGTLSDGGVADISFETNGKPRMSAPVFTLEEGTLTAEVAVDAANFAGDIDSAAIMLVYYKGDKALGVSASSAKGVETINGVRKINTSVKNVSSLSGEYHAKVFRLSAADGAPLCPGVTFSN